MSKQQMIDMIREQNRSARPEFLVRFEEPVLENYLRRLTTLHNHRGKSSVWVRQGDAPASIGRFHSRA